MINIIHIFLSFIFLECFLLNPSGIINKRLIPIIVEAKFLNKDVQQADIYVAELSEDIGIRLNQILNNEITYKRQSINLIDQDDSLSNINKRNFVNILDPDHQEELKKIINEKHLSLNDNLDFSIYQKESIMEDYTPYLDRNNKNRLNTNQNKGTVSSDNNSNSNSNKGQTSSGSNDQDSHSGRNGRKNHKDSPGQNNRKVNVNFYHSISVKEEELVKSNNNNTLSREIATKPFDFTIECMDSEKECLYINDRLESASTYISNIFNIYKTINVEVHILPFCKHMGGDNCGMITALTYAPTFVTLNITGHGIYSYPQSLVKQLEVSERIKNYSSYDISLYFNTDYLKDHNYGNYLLVAAHEIIHGMGFFHLMTTASSAFKMDFPEDRIIPQPLVHSYRTSQGNEKAYHGWIPFTVFDRYIVEVDHPDYYIHHGLQDYLEDVQVHKFTSEEAVIEHFENLDISPPSHVYSKSLAPYFSTREAIGFRTYDGEVVILQTFDEYESMSSISHIHAPFSCVSSLNCYVPKEKLEKVDDNYLMYYTIISRPVNELMERYSRDSSHGFIGEKIIKIMKTMGWTEKQDLSYFREYQNMILSREASVASKTYSTIITTSYIFFISFLYILFIILF